MMLTRPAKGLLVGRRIVYRKGLKDLSARLTYESVDLDGADTLLSLGNNYCNVTTMKMAVLIHKIFYKTVKKRNDIKRRN